MRLIDADALMEKLVSLQKKFNSNKGMDIDVFACVATINAMPTVDAMPVKSAVQLKWERDEAIQKLEEHGIPFCGKADVVAVVRCGECKHSYHTMNGKTKSSMRVVLACSEMDDREVEPDWYCADGERRSECD